MRNLILFLIVWSWFVYVVTAKADDFGVHLQEVSVDYARFKEDTRDPILYPNKPKEKLDLNLNISLLKYGYMSNTVHSLTDDSQFRLIGWHYQLGVHVLQYADIYMDHFSQHRLDTEGPFFPVENSVGIKLYLYRR